MTLHVLYPRRVRTPLIRFLAAWCMNLGPLLGATFTLAGMYKPCTASMFGIRGDDYRTPLHKAKYCRDVIDPYLPSCVLVCTIFLRLPPIHILFVNSVLCGMWEAGRYIYSLDDVQLHSTAVVHYIVGGVSILASFVYLVMREYLTLEQLRQAVQTARLRHSSELRATEADTLLCAMVPHSVLMRVMDGVPVRDYTANATVFFSDMVRFTSWSSTRSAREVLDLLNTLCIDLDVIASEIGVTKIKTIGDAYWAVTGLPDEDAEHAHRMVRFGLLFQQTALRIAMGPIGQKFGWLDVRFRVGIHSGPLRGAVLGTQSLSYEVMGPTSHAAEEVEKAGIAAEVVISSATAAALVRGAQSPPLNRAHRGDNDGDDENGNDAAPIVCIPSFRPLGHVPATAEGLLLAAPTLYELKRCDVMQFHGTKYDLFLVKPMSATTAAAGGGVGANNESSPNSLNIDLLRQQSVACVNRSGDNYTSSQLRGSNAGGGGASGDFAVLPSPVVVGGGATPAGVNTAAAALTSDNAAAVERNKRRAFMMKRKKQQGAGGASTAHANSNAQHELKALKAGAPYITVNNKHQVDTEDLDVAEGNHHNNNNKNNHIVTIDDDKAALDFEGSQLDSGNGSNPISESGEMLEMRLQLRKYKYLLQNFQDVVLEHDFVRFTAGTSLWYRTTSYASFLAWHIVLFLCPLIEGAEYSTAFHALQGVACGAALLLIPSARFSSYLQSILIGVASITSLIGSWTLGYSAIGNDVSFQSPFSMLMFCLVTPLNPLVKLLFALLTVVVPTCFAIQSTIYIVGNGLFVVLMSILIVLQALMMETVSRTQFIQSRVAERYARDALEHEEEQQWLLQSVVPAHIVPALLTWLRTDMRPNASVVHEYPCVCVAFIQLIAPPASHAANAHKRHHQKIQRVAAKAFRDESSGGESVRDSQPHDEVEEEGEDSVAFHWLLQAQADLENALSHVCEMMASGQARGGGCSRLNDSAAKISKRNSNMTSAVDSSSALLAKGGDGGGRANRKKRASSFGIVATSSLVDVEMMDENDTHLYSSRSCNPNNSNNTNIYNSSNNNNNGIGAQRSAMANNNAATDGAQIIKVKTVGDITMLAGSFTDGSPADAAVALLHVISRIASQHTVRVGLNVGPVAGAVLGTERLCFDIFGDTVNLTSRAMTSVVVSGDHGGGVNATDAFVKLIRNKDSKDAPSSELPPMVIDEAVVHELKGKGTISLRPIRLNAAP